MTGLDTAIVPRLLVGEPSDQAVVGRDFPDTLVGRGEQAVVSGVVLSEIYFALQFARRVPTSATLDAPRSLFQSSEITRKRPENRL